MAYPYQKHIWVTKEIIRREYLQNIEDGIYDEQQERLTQEEALNQAILDEEGRARRAEVALGNSIDAETVRATAAENNLASNIVTERTRAVSAETDLRNDLSSLGNRVTSEISRATAAEDVLTTNLANEITRATGIENALTSNLNAEITRATRAEQTLTTNLSAEITRSTGAEQTLTTNLNAEIARATAAEAAISAKVTVAYKAAGSVFFIDLPAAIDERQGFVYDIKDAFTTTNDFVEGSGNEYPAGTNVVIIGVENSGTVTYMYDVLPGFIDTSDFVTNTDYATSSVPGLVKPDNSTTTVDANGTLTVIGGGGGGDSTNFIGTTDEWDALTPEQQNLYKSKDITNDFNGLPIDSYPTQGSGNVVSSGGVYSYINTMITQALTASY